MSAGEQRSTGRMGRVVRAVQQSRLPQMAAALSFRTVFGILPMLFVGLVAARYFVSQEDVARSLRQGFRFFGVEAIVEDAVVEERGDWRSPMNPLVIEEPPEQEARDLVDVVVREMLANIKTFDLTVPGIVALLTLLYAAISMLVEIERSFNQICRVPVGRSWARRVTQYWTLLTLGTLFLFGTFYVGERFKAWGVSLVLSPEQQAGASPAAIVRGIGFGVTVAISTVLLLLAYTVVPNTRLRLTPALAGAMFAAVLWESGKWGFTQYLAYSTSIERVWGRVAIVPLFLLWVYVTWVIVLVGLHVGCLLDRRARGVVEAERGTAVLVDPSVALSMMLMLAERFGAGKAATREEVASEAGVSPATAHRVLDALVDAGFAHRVQARGASRWALARPPESVSASGVLEVGEALVRADGRAGSRAAEGVERLIATQRRAALGDRTLGGIAETLGVRTSGPGAGGAASEGAGPPATGASPRGDRIVGRAAGQGGGAAEATG